VLQLATWIKTGGCAALVEEFRVEKIGKFLQIKTVFSICDAFKHRTNVPLHTPAQAIT
jgi:hypothetical protein